VSQDHDRRVLAGENAVESEEIFPSPDGPRTLLTIRFPLRDRHGRIYAVAGIGTDITDRKQAETEVREALTRRDQFLAMLSHELRNPLGAILNAARVLAKESADKQLHQEARAVIQRQATQMARLLDDLLDVTRISQNRIRVQKTVIDFNNIVREVLHVIEPAYSNAGVELHTDISPSPLFVYGDEAGLQQMLVNLMLNAAKYTPQGGKVWLSEQAQDDQIIVRVKDNGVGIRPDMLEKVFDLFVQVNETLDRADGGMGVGLTLVRTIVEMHEGSIRCHSDGPGKGTEFSVCLPRSSERPAHAQPPTEAIPGPAHVVVIEDNSDSRRMLEAMLKLDGYVVHSEADGQAGLAAILKNRPRVALIDIGLPNLNGYDVAKRVRSVMSRDEVCLIALTGYGRPEDRLAVQEAGFDEHLVKPLKPEELAIALKRVSIAS